MTQEVVTLLEEIQAQQGDKRRPDLYAHWVAVPGPAPSPHAVLHESLKKMRRNYSQFNWNFNFTNFIFPKYIYIGEGNGTPFQYCCLENPMDRGAW